jgi:hypothetical protein
MVFHRAEWSESVKLSLLPTKFCNNQILWRHCTDDQHSQRPKVTEGRGEPRRWEQLYLAANLELNPAKLPQRIDDARYAILDRIADHFSAKSLDEEQVELRVALEVLDFLRERAV